MTYPNNKVVLPQELKGIPNGQIPAHLLYTVKGGGQLTRIAAWYWTCLVNECAKADVTLTYTGTYRSLPQQTTLFNQRYSLQPVSNNRKVWQGKTYYLRPGMAGAAVPGTSNHGYGIAIDVALNGYGRDAEPINKDALDVILYINAAHSLGFSWEGNPSSAMWEPWHLNHAAGK